MEPVPIPRPVTLPSHCHFIGHRTDVSHAYPSHFDFAFVCISSNMILVCCGHHHIKRPVFKHFAPREFPVVLQILRLDSVGRVALPSNNTDGEPPWRSGYSVRRVQPTGRAHLFNLIKFNLSLGFDRTFVTSAAP
jgi:hypothetical protein